MKIKLVVLFLAGLISVSLPKNNDVFETPNVRTVLFRKSDLSKECWNKEELALLFSRRMMQELVPKRIPNDITAMLDYLKSCLETVKEMAPSRKTHALILSALTDTFGGYLQAYGLPAAKEAYYEGIVSYSVAKQLHELEEAFKKTLRTNGVGWTRPVEIETSPRVKPLQSVMFDVASRNPCENLIHSVELISLPRNKGCVEGENSSSKPCDEDKSNSKPKIHVSSPSVKKTMRVGVPFLDDPKCPTAIAVPFKDRSLFSLSTKGSSDVLVKYYTNGLACVVKEMGHDDSSINEFSNNFKCWIEKSVLPHLHDEKWYPGFGNVLKIYETIKKNGTEFFSTPQPSAVIDEKTKQTSVIFYVAIVATVLLGFWLIVLIVYIIYHFCIKEKTTCNSSSRASTVSSDSTLGSLYCDRKGKVDKENESSSKSSQARTRRKRRRTRSSHKN